MFSTAIRIASKASWGERDPMPHIPGLARRIVKNPTQPLPARHSSISTSPMPARPGLDFVLARGMKPGGLHRHRPAACATS